MPTAGDITVLGRRFGESDWRELRKHIGLVSSAIRQLMADNEPALETVISGRLAMIDLWGRVSRADRGRGLRLLRQIECSHLADRPWLQLSQGERQRVLIGRALMARPRLLILDEPCVGLDPAARDHFLHFLQRLGRATSRPHPRPRHPSRRGNHPRHLTRLNLESRPRPRGRPKTAVLNSAALSAAFGAPIQLSKKSGRYSPGRRPLLPPRRLTGQPSTLIHFTTSPENRVLQPQQIHQRIPRSGGNAHARILVLVQHLPPPALRVPVRKRKSPAPRVPRRRRIPPVQRVGLRGKIAVVNRVHALIHKHNRFRRRRARDFDLSLVPR